MKKRHILLLVLAVSLLLCSCGEVKIESITLSKNAAELKEGESVTLSAVARRRTQRRATAGNPRTRALQRWMRTAS